MAIPPVIVDPFGSVGSCLSFRGYVISNTEVQDGCIL